jgi:hypothetical protein
MEQRRGCPHIHPYPQPVVHNPLCETPPPKHFAGRSGSGSGSVYRLPSTVYRLPEDRGQSGSADGPNPDNRETDHRITDLEGVYRLPEDRGQETAPF